MRVLHIYSGNLYGGIEKMLVTLARCRNLCPEMEPHFALCFEGRLSEELRATGAPVHMLGNVRASRPGSVLRARKALRDLLTHTSFDAGVCHAPWAQAIFGPVVNDAGLTQIFWMHNVADGRHWSERWARRTEPQLAICNSLFTASTLRNIYPRVHAEVLYCPVAFSQPSISEEERRAVRKELDTPEDATVIIQVSRMEAWKGQMLHLEALSKLPIQANWFCWMVGGAQRPHEIKYLAELAHAVELLGLSGRVRMTGDRSDVPRLLAAADIHCQPNTHPEPFGITFVEALFAGLPVITTALGGAQEIVNESCGILVPPGDADQLSNALERLITDEPLRRRLGTAGPPRSKELCQPARQLDQLYSALSSVLHMEMAG